MADA
jgi:hypothetical protein